MHFQIKNTLKNNHNGKSTPHKKKQINLIFYLNFLNYFELRCYH